MKVVSGPHRVSWFGDVGWTKHWVKVPEYMLT